MHILPILSINLRVTAQIFAHYQHIVLHIVLHIMHIVHVYWNIFLHAFMFFACHGYVTFSLRFFKFRDIYHIYSKHFTYYLVFSILIAIFLGILNYIYIMHV
jgi:hypothetical protein